ncbi:reverse transcriptase RNA-dependent DNA polymerase [Nitzschia inconspicua]|uniref:Reverse transcriptase RNA-dependent DNA polymerase n=1 Tax=Nitzschia inconspicua TaxID=303405 RepID=A0A9K3LK83_9STRA|nr:reverse transcriptase RNA-dependent DNA polymerase [Nitzschia inconspicua]
MVSLNRCSRFAGYRDVSDTAIPIALPPSPKWTRQSHRIFVRCLPLSLEIRIRIFGRFVFYVVLARNEVKKARCEGSSSGLSIPDYWSLLRVTPNQRSFAARNVVKHHDTVVQTQRHLSADQQADLSKLLRKHSKLFSGKLGEYRGRKIHLEIDPSVKPSRSRPYTVPINHQQVFKEELDRLVRIGVLEKCGRSEWIACTFIIPKKDGRIRWISDFRALNKALKRQVYHLPKIGDILARRTNYQFFTKLDVSMQYYTFVLDDESKALTTIATPFGTYRYRRLPLGICQSPDIAQEIMEHVLQGLNENVEVYIDDIGCFSNSWNSHIDLLVCVLTRLENAGFTINPIKCEWGVKETDFLGHWLTPTGHKPWKKKVDAILAMQPPTNLKQLRSFLGLVTFYRDMWPHCSHTLAPI